MNKGFVQVSKLVLMGVGLSASALALPFIPVAQVPPVEPDMFGWAKTLASSGEKALLSIIVVALTFALLKLVNIYRKDTQAAKAQTEASLKEVTTAITRSTDTQERLLRVIDKCHEKSGA